MTHADIKQQVNDARQRFQHAVLISDQIRKSASEEHVAEVKRLQTECAKIGHKDDGGFMYGNCEFCGEFLG